MALEDATENPRPGGGFFELSGRLDDLPGFGFDSEGRLVDSPMHPVPLDPSRATTLEDVLDRLSDEEKKYDSCEVTVNQCYVFLKTIQGTAARSGESWGYCRSLGEVVFPCGVVTSEGMPALLNVGVEVQNDQQKPGTFFIGDPELNPADTRKGWRFTLMYFDEREQQL